MAASPRVLGKLLSLNPTVPHVDLTRRETLFGRNAACNVTFESLQVSKQHCKVICSDAGVFVRDLSTNGTWIDRTKKIGKGQLIPLHNGQELSLVLPRSRHQVFGDGIISFVFQDLSTPTAEVVIKEMAETGVRKAYTFIKELGHGSFGTVWLAQKGKQSYAVKVINKHKFVTLGGRVQQMFSEVEVMDKLSHPNVININDVFNTPSYLVLVLELCNGGDLQQLIDTNKRLSESSARICFHQIVTALSYLHDNKIVHRDLKPENILVKKPVGGHSSPKLVLVDFGLAKALGDTSMTTTVCGTPLYIAPEVLVCGVSGWAGYGAAVDMWAAGLILYQMLCGALPFSTAPTAEPLHVQISYGMRPDFRLRYPDHVSAPARDLISRLVTMPSRRLTAHQALRHEWLSKKQERAKRPRPAAHEIGRLPTLVTDSMVDDGVAASTPVPSPATAHSGAGAGAGAGAGRRRNQLADTRRATARSEGSPAASKKRRQQY